MSECRKKDVKGHCRIQSQTWIDWVHEALLFMSLEAEDSYPKVKWRHKDYAAQSVDCGTLRGFGENLLDDEDWHGNTCQHKPNVEVEEKVFDVEMPRLRSEYLRSSSSSAEDVVHYNFPRDDHWYFVEEGVDQEFDKL